LRQRTSTRGENDDEYYSEDLTRALALTLEPPNAKVSARKVIHDTTTLASTKAPTRARRKACIGISMTVETPSISIVKSHRTEDKSELTELLVENGENVVRGIREVNVTAGNFLVEHLDGSELFL
jgi:hypothetical protein